MKIEFTIHSPAMLRFDAIVTNDQDAWRLLGVLSAGQSYPVTHIVFPEFTETPVPPILKR